MIECERKAASACRQRLQNLYPGRDDFSADTVARDGGDFVGFHGVLSARTGDCGLTIAKTRRAGKGAWHGVAVLRWRWGAFARAPEQRCWSAWANAREGDRNYDDVCQARLPPYSQ